MVKDIVNFEVPSWVKVYHYNTLMKFLCIG